MFLLHERINAENNMHFVSGVATKVRSLCVLANAQEVNVCSPILYSSVSKFDFTYGCCYRNLQMMISCLATRSDFYEVLFKGFVGIPTVPKIQMIIEKAWKEGFDSCGQIELKGSLVHTSKWIGPEEMLAFFAMFRIKYFERGATFMPPLYLQHKGHSRLIVGMEKDCNGTRHLLLFDPALKRSQVEKIVRRTDQSDLAFFQASIADFTQDAYQILYINGLMKDDSEIERAKKGAYFEKEADEPTFP